MAIDPIWHWKVHHPQKHHQYYTTFGYINIYIYHISGTILAEKQIKMMNNEEEQFAKCLLEPSLKQDDHGEQTGNGNGMTFSSICQIDVRRCTKDAPDSQELPRDCQLEVIVIGNCQVPSSFYAHKVPTCSDLGVATVPNCAALLCGRCVVGEVSKEIYLG